MLFTKYLNRLSFLCGGADEMRDAKAPTCVMVEKVEGKIDRNCRVKQKQMENR